MHKLIANVVDPSLPGLSAIVTKLGQSEFHIRVLRLPDDAFYAPTDLPRFSAILNPTLYVHPSGVMTMVVDFATSKLHEAAAYLNARGEYHAGVGA
jgi:hypothetical protein